MKRSWVMGSLLVLAACDGGVPLESLPTEAASVICGIAETCFGRLADRVGGGSECRMDLEGGFANGALPRWQAAIDAGTLTYDPALGSACVDAQRAAGCSIFISPPPQACRDMFTGTVAVGGACSLNEECAGDAYCAGAGCPDVPGTCTARTGSGSACTSTEQCQSGLLCENQVCRAPQSASGGTCGGTTGLACPIDQICVTPGEGMPGTCTPLTTVFAGSVGEPCDLRSFDFCSPELSCVVTGLSGTEPAMSCAAIASSGGTCNGGIPDMCPLGEYCDAQPFMLMFEGTCRPSPTAGQPCAMNLSGSVCAPGLECVGGNCIEVRDNGESCTMGAGCYSGYCDAGRCAPLPLCS